MAAAEGQNFDLGGDALRLEAEPAGQFAIGKVISLVDDRQPVRHIRQPDPVQREIAGQRIRRHRRGFDLLYRMQAAIAAQQRHAGRQRDCRAPASPPRHWKDRREVPCGLIL